MKKITYLLISILFMTFVFSCSHTKKSGQEISVLPEEVSETVPADDGKSPSAVGMSETDWDAFFAEAKIKQKQTEEARALAAQAKETKPEPEEVPVPEEPVKNAEEELPVQEVMSDIPAEEVSEPVPEAPKVPPVPVFASVTVREIPEEPKPEDNVKISGEDVRTVTPVRDDSAPADNSAEPASDPVIYIYEEGIAPAPDGEDGEPILKEIREKYHDINTEKAPAKDNSETMRLIVMSAVALSAGILMCLLIKRVTYRRSSRKKTAVEEPTEEKREEFVPASFTPGQDEFPDELYAEMEDRPEDGESGNGDNPQTEADDVKNENSDENPDDSEQQFLDVLDEE